MGSEDASRPVWILAGPGCAELASVIFPGVQCYDWEEAPAAAALAGRELTLWGPSWTDSTKLGARYVKQAASVALVDVREDDNIDFASLLQKRRDADSVHDFAKLRSRIVGKPGKALTQSVTPAPSAYATWQDLGLDCNSNGEPFPTIANAASILLLHPPIKDRIWFNAFTGKIMQTIDGVDSAWTDAEDLQVCIWLQQTLKLPKLGLQTAVHAIQAAAFQRRRNPLTEWLSSLVWDGQERLDTWLTEYLGAPFSPYSEALGRNWLVSMVARAFSPGCQVDHMPVLEGAMGRGKSTALSILGGPWYKATPQAFGSKEFFEVIIGAWLVEIPDMAGFQRREHSQIISAITTRVDSFRAAYARHATDNPRTCVFAATSENDDYLQDSRGIRRYLPLRCGDIKLDALRAIRDQLFAEAATLFKRGATWHEMPDRETLEEQQARQEHDLWLQPIANYCGAAKEVTSEEVVTRVLDIELGKQGKADEMRIGKCLKRIGFNRRQRRVNGAPKWVWQR